MLHPAEVPQRADASEDAPAHHQGALGRVHQQQLVVVVSVHGLLAGVGDGRRAQPVVPFGARVEAGQHLEVRAQLLERVDGTDVQKARPRVGHHVVDQAGGEEL